MINDHLNKNSAKLAILNSIGWAATETDLIEMAASLFYNKSIYGKTEQLSKKNAVRFFSVIFDLNIENVEVKLSKAMVRKKDVAPFLTKLRDAIITYADNRLL